jgi:4-hydroxybenzoyl-CoA reductase subunit beta
MTRGLPSFTLERATDLRSATLLLAEPGACALGGGTDLLPNLRRGIGEPASLVDLSNVPEIAAIVLEPDGTLVIGAGVTVQTLAEDGRVDRALPALAEAARAVAAGGHRSAATVGGNLCQDTRCVFYNQSEWWRSANGYCLKHRGSRCHVAPLGDRCHAAFCSDLAPVLLAAGAQVHLCRADAGRVLDLQDLYHDDGAAHLALQPGELLAHVRVPTAPASLRLGYDKARSRGGIDFPLAAVAVAMQLDQGRILALRVGISGTNSSPLLVDAGADLQGGAADEATWKKVQQLVQRQLTPMRSTVTSAQYRRDAAGALLARLLRQLSE